MPDAPARRGRRVVVTGAGGVCALGADWPTVRAKLREGVSGVQQLPDFAGIDRLRTRLGAPAPEVALPDRHPRKKLRGMGRVALLGAFATEAALAQARLDDDALLSAGSLGLAYGSTSGSPPAMVTWARAFGVDHSAKGVVPTDYAKLMSHTCVANLAQLFGIRGRVISTCSACASGSQAVGYGYESIRFGRQDVMVCGGAEELHVIEAAVFDLLQAASTRNDDPDSTPRPFDADRDGLVVGEGAATLVLEELEHARRRGAEILAEVAGFGTTCDGFDLMRPDTDGMQRAMQAALADAELPPEAIGYVNAHATATPAGDVAESRAIEHVFGARTPVSSLKGHIGHTLGACGALEAWMTLHMQREGWLAPTLNLERVDPACAGLDHVRGGTRATAVEYAVSNSFAFGGVNSVLVLRRWSN